MQKDVLGVQWSTAQPSFDLYRTRIMLLPFALFLPTSSQHSKQYSFVEITHEKNPIPWIECDFFI